MSGTKPVDRENYQDLSKHILNLAKEIQRAILPTLELAYLRGKQAGEEKEKERSKK